MSEAALLKSVLASPDDDLPRLVLADWWEENGQPERAEFVRVQVELAKLPLYKDDYSNCRHCDGDGYSEPPPYHRVCRPCNGTGKKDHAEYTRNVSLRQRERAMLVNHHREFFRPPDGYSPTTMTVSGPQDGNLCWIFGATPGRFINFIVRRGFVSEVRCRLNDWCGGCRHTFCENGYWRHSGDSNTRPRRCPDCSGTGRVTGTGPTVVASHPVEKVVLTDVEPYQNGGGYCWYDADRPHPQTGGHRAKLPSVVFRNLPRKLAVRQCDRWAAYTTSQDATAALSTACLTWARSVTV